MVSKNNKNDVSYTITRELLRKSSEHNEMCLSTLEEITLHQRELKKIDLLETYCKKLKIVLLQNNIIEKMEGLSKLKDLQYLNMGLNNISVIEGLDGCESLFKLDMTCNFIEIWNLEKSLRNIQHCEKLENLYLMGNPCMDWAPAINLVYAFLPQLKQLDGKDIPKSAKILAIQKKDQLLEDLQVEVARRQIEVEQERLEAEMNGPTYNEKGERLYGYSRSNRTEMYEELAEDKLRDDKIKYPDKYKPKKPLSRKFMKSGRVRMCNEGGYKFHLNEYDDAEYTTFTVKIPKFCDTSLIEVDIKPTYVSVRVKTKLTQLRFEEEVIVEGATIQRSQITGELVIKVKKLKPNYVMANAIKRDKDREIQKRKDVEAKKKEEDELIKRLIEKQEEKVRTIKEVKEKEEEEIDYTLDDIPDLE